MMRTLSFRRNAGNIDLPQIDEIEKKYSIRLPPDYKDFLVRYNGIYSNEDTFVKGENIYTVQGFYPIGHSESYTGLDTAISISKEFLPMHMVPFAYNPGGNYFLLSVGSDDYGKVYFHFSDAEPGYEFELLANDFTEFINTLKTYEESQA